MSKTQFGKVFVAAGLAAGFAVVAATGAGASAPPDGSAPLREIPDPAECAEGLTLNEGVLTIATGDPAFPPYVIDDDPTSKQGFEAAVAYAVAELLGFTDDDEVAWVRTTFDGAIAPGPKDFDFNIQQYSIDAVRDEVVDFSLPYYEGTQAIFGPADGAGATAATLADIQALRIGVATGTTSLVFAEEVLAPEGGVQIFNDNAGVVSALQSNQLDAAIADLPTAMYVAFVEMENGAVYGQFRTTDETAGEPWGMLFEEGNPLVECVNNAILILRQTGELDAITEEWMTEGTGVPFIDIDG
jgi:polar amino acid transport system substrate-binding protein